MGKYILKRFSSSIFTLFIVTTLTFFMLRFMPGSPFLSEKISPKALAQMEAKYGLDKPVTEQYVIFLKNLLKGDFGSSMIYKGKDVTGDIIFKFFPNSAKLGICAVVVSTFFGIIFGILAALQQGKALDKMATFIATIGITIPSFVVSSLLIYFVAVKWQLLDASGLDSWKSYILPTIALSGTSMAFITRLTRTEFVEVLKSDYMRTAKAKGLSSFEINYKHGLKNAIIPVVTYLGPLISMLLTGSFIVEKIFAIPGLGRDFVQSVLNRDYSVVIGVVVFYCSFIIIMNFIVDVLYVIIDPRIKLQETEN